MADACVKLDAVLRSYAGWQGRVGVDNRLIAALREFLEGAYLSGYTQALIDNGLSLDLMAEIEQRNKEPR